MIVVRDTGSMLVHAYNRGVDHLGPKQAHITFPAALCDQIEWRNWKRDYHAELGT
jgi:hypothetical protein